MVHRVSGKGIKKDDSPIFAESPSRDKHPLCPKNPGTMNVPPEYFSLSRGISSSKSTGIAMKPFLAWLAVFVSSLVVVVSTSAQSLEFKQGDHVCIIGNALGDRMQHHGW